MGKKDPAHDELDTCKMSVVSPEQPVLVLCLTWSTYQHGHIQQLAADHVAGPSSVRSQLCSHRPLWSCSVQLLFVLGLA